MSRSKLALLHAQKPSLLVRQLMDILFTADEMARCSVTGKGSNKKIGQAIRPGLDAAKVSAVLGKNLSCLGHLVVNQVEEHLIHSHS